MFYGQTNRKIRSYFKELRKYARREGGAIGFIEEIDAIGGARGGMGQGRHHDGVAGVVNELLIQLQSFDQPPASDPLARAPSSRPSTAGSPPGTSSRKPVPPPANILVIGATNRAADLDPALVRPGRFDRSIYFDLPSRVGAARDHRLLPRTRRRTTSSWTTRPGATPWPPSPSVTRP